MNVRCEIKVVMLFMMVSRCVDVCIDGIPHHFLSLIMCDGGGIVSTSDGLKRSRLRLRVCATTRMHRSVEDISVGCVGGKVVACIMADNAV